MKKKYIDLEMTLAKFDSDFNNPFAMAARNLIKQIPTIDVEVSQYGSVAPRDYEIHARWIANNICSHCKTSVDGWAAQLGYKTCPNCFAIMDL